jgi:hypothetical protein
MSYSITVKHLSGQAFVGFSAADKLTDWVNVEGTWGYGSSGVRGSHAGYDTSGPTIDPRTGRKHALESWGAGDVLVVSVDAHGVMSVSRNGQAPVVLYDNVTAAAVGKPLTVSVWTAPSSSGSSFAFTGEAGADIPPSCITAAAVTSDPSVPFVVSTRYPGSHAVSISTLARTSPRPVGYHTPPVNVSQSVLLGRKDAQPDGTLPPIGVFGSFGSLALEFAPGTASHIAAVRAQDLRGDDAVDITRDVAVDTVGDSVTLSGALIARVGTAARTAGDLSEPGLVVVVVLKQAADAE